MGFLIVGLLLVTLKLLEVAPVGGWSWWAVLTPFVVALLWWQWSDWSGMTQRRAMQRETDRARARRAERARALGTTIDGPRKRPPK